MQNMPADEFFPKNVRLDVPRRAKDANLSPVSTVPAPQANGRELRRESHVVSVTADPTDASVAIITFSEPVFIQGQDGGPADNGMGNVALHVPLTVEGLEPNEQVGEGPTTTIAIDFFSGQAPGDVRGRTWSYPSNSRAVLTSTGRQIQGGSGVIPR